MKFKAYAKRRLRVKTNQNNSNKESPSHTSIDESHEKDGKKGNKSSVTSKVQEKRGSAHSAGGFRNTDSSEQTSGFSRNSGRMSILKTLETHAKFNDKSTLPHWGKMTVMSIAPESKDYDLASHVANIMEKQADSQFNRLKCDMAVRLQQINLRVEKALSNVGMSRVDEPLEKHVDKTVESTLNESQRRASLSVKLRESIFDSSERTRILEELLDWFLITRNYMMQDVLTVKELYSQETVINKISTNIDDAMMNTLTAISKIKRMGHRLMTSGGFIDSLGRRRMPPRVVDEDTLVNDFGGNLDAAFMVVRKCQEELSKTLKSPNLRMWLVTARKQTNSLANALASKYMELVRLQKKSTDYQLHVKRLNEQLSSAEVKVHQLEADLKAANETIEWQKIDLQNLDHMLSQAYEKANYFKKKASLNKNLLSPAAALKTASNTLTSQSESDVNAQEFKSPNLSSMIHSSHTAPEGLVMVDRNALLSMHTEYEHLKKQFAKKEKELDSSRGQSPAFTVSNPPEFEKTSEERGPDNLRLVMPEKTSTLMKTLKDEKAKTAAYTQELADLQKNIITKFPDIFSQNKPVYSDYVEGMRNIKGLISHLHEFVTKKFIELSNTKANRSRLLRRPESPSDSINGPSPSPITESETKDSTQSSLASFTDQKESLKGNKKSPRKKFSQKAHEVMMIKPVIENMKTPQQVQGSTVTQPAPSTKVPGLNFKPASAHQESRGLTGNPATPPSKGQGSNTYLAASKDGQLSSNDVKQGEGAKLVSKVPYELPQDTSLVKSPKKLTKASDEPSQIKSKIEVYNNSLLTPRNSNHGTDVGTESARDSVAQKKDLGSAAAQKKYRQNADVVSDSLSENSRLKTEVEHNLVQGKSKMEADVGSDSVSGKARLKSDAEDSVTGHSRPLTGFGGGSVSRSAGLKTEDGSNLVQGNSRVKSDAGTDSFSGNARVTARIDYDSSTGSGKLKAEISSNLVRGTSRIKADGGNDSPSGNSQPNTEVGSNLVRGISKLKTDGGNDSPSGNSQPNTEVGSNLVHGTSRINADGGSDSPAGNPQPNTEVGNNLVRGISRLKTDGGNDSPSENSQPNTEVGSNLVRGVSRLKTDGGKDSPSGNSPPNSEVGSNLERGISRLKTNGGNDSLSGISQPNTEVGSNLVQGVSKLKTDDGHDLVSINTRPNKDVDSNLVRGISRLKTDDASDSPQGNTMLKLDIAIDSLPGSVRLKTNNGNDLVPGISGLNVDVGSKSIPGESKPNTYVVRDPVPENARTDFGSDIVPEIVSLKADVVRDSAPENSSLKAEVRSYPVSENVRSITEVVSDSVPRNFRLKAEILSDSVPENAGLKVDFVSDSVTADPRTLRVVVNDSVPENAGMITALGSHSLSEIDRLKTEVGGDLVLGKSQLTAAASAVLPSGSMRNIIYDPSDGTKQQAEERAVSLSGNSKQKAEGSSMLYPRQNNQITAGNQPHPGKSTNQPIEIPYSPTRAIRNKEPNAQVPLLITTAPSSADIHHEDLEDEVTRVPESYQTPLKYTSYRFKASPSYVKSELEFKEIHEQTDSYVTSSFKQVTMPLPEPKRTETDEPTKDLMMASRSKRFKLPTSPVVFKDSKSNKSFYSPVQSSTNQYEHNLEPMSPLSFPRDDKSLIPFGSVENIFSEITPELFQPLDKSVANLILSKWLLVKQNVISFLSDLEDKVKRMNALRKSEKLKHESEVKELLSTIQNQSEIIASLKHDKLTSAESLEKLTKTNKMLTRENIMARQKEDKKCGHMMNELDALKHDFQFLQAELRKMNAEFLANEDVKQKLIADLEEQKLQYEKIMALHKVLMDLLTNYATSSETPKVKSGEPEGISQQRGAPDTPSMKTSITREDFMPELLQISHSLADPLNKLNDKQKKETFIRQYIDLPSSSKSLAAIIRRSREYDDKQHSIINCLDNLHKKIDEKVDFINGKRAKLGNMQAGPGTHLATGDSSQEPCTPHEKSSIKRTIIDQATKFIMDNHMISNQPAATNELQASNCIVRHPELWSRENSIVSSRTPNKCIRSSQEILDKANSKWQEMDIKLSSRLSDAKGPKHQARLRAVRGYFIKEHKAELPALAKVGKKVEVTQDSNGLGHLGLPACLRTSSSPHPPSHKTDLTYHSVEFVD